MDTDQVAKFSTGALVNTSRHLASAVIACSEFGADSSLKASNVGDLPACRTVAKCGVRRQAASARGSGKPATHQSMVWLILTAAWCQKGIDACCGLVQQMEDLRRRLPDQLTGRPGSCGLRAYRPAASLVGNGGSALGRLPEKRVLMPAMKPLPEDYASPKGET